MNHLDAVARLAGLHPTVMPVWRDLPPPSVSAVDVCRLVGGSALLETDEWSLVGIDPVTTLQVHGGDLRWTDGPICPDKGGLAEVLGAVAGPPPIPLLAASCAICVLGADAFRDRPTGKPAGGPDAVVIFPSAVVFWEASWLRLAVFMRITPDRDIRELHTEAQSRLDELQARLAAAPAPGGPLPIPAAVPEPSFDSDLPDPAYRDLIEAAHRRILAGEARQVTISRRFRAPAHAVDPVTVYRVLRETNRSAYHVLLRLPGGVTLVGASPQRLVRVDDRRVSVPVIAGTRRRGPDPATDAALAAELLADPKEREEHAMLVELAQADLAGVAEPGTVQVVGGAPEVRRYGRVMHLVSEVTGELAAGRTALDALTAAFPAGTVAGTPRDAALRIIEEVEPRTRGLYGGGIGWLGFSGALDFCLGIRTLVFEGDQATCQAGAGVVADSVPDREVRESRDKASALFAALEAAASA